MAKGDKLNRHHVLPRSRGGQDDNNIVLWDSGFHAAYHKLFNNMTLEEAIAFLRTVSQPGEYWDGGKLERMRKLIKGETDDCSL